MASLSILQKYYKEESKSYKFDGPNNYSDFEPECKEAVDSCVQHLRDALETLTDGPDDSDIAMAYSNIKSAVDCLEQAMSHKS